MTHAQQLAAIAANPDQKAKVEQYKSALHSIVASASVEACRAFVDHSGCCKGLGFGRSLVGTAS